MVEKDKRVEPVVKISGTQSAIDQGNQMALLARAPSFLILGAQKSGTQALRNYLLQHPLTTYLDNGKKELYFFSWRFDPFTIEGKAGVADILVDEARIAHAKYYQLSKLRQNPALVAFDSTPDYLFQADKIAPRVHRVNPWAKLIALIRNPVDRAYSDYTMEYNRKRFDGTFEDYISPDIDRLKQAGFVRDWNSEGKFAKFAGSSEEAAAWSVYWHMHADGMHPIGRGIYSVQLRRWFKEYGQDSIDGLQQRFLVLNSDEMRGIGGIVSTYERTLSFLNLPQHKLSNATEHHVGQYENGPMKAKTRAMLEKFYAPYNRQLESLLGEQWRGTWEVVSVTDGAY